MSKSGQRPKVLVFDVNETLLDLSALQPHFQRLFGEERALKEWFSLLLQYSLVVTITERYSDFGTLGRAALRMLAQARKVQLQSEDEDGVLRALTSLPAHPEVHDALDQLKHAGFRMATLTNSSSSMIRDQLKNSGLESYFEQPISVDAVQRFKPDRRVYAFAAEQLKVEASQACLIAAHAWDVFGAMNAGWMAAFIARPGKALFPVAPTPAMIAPDLLAFANLLTRES
jgi:2-haloacid dehalogenase